MNRWVLTLALLALAGCSSLEPVALGPAERAYLREVLEAAPVGSATEGVALVGSSLDTVAGLVRGARRAVVELRVEAAPSAWGYLGGLGSSSLAAVSELPNPWSILRPPVYLLFGWVLEFFKESRGTGFVIGRQEETAWILTNAHVVGDRPQKIQVTTWDGRPRQATGSPNDDAGWPARVAWIDPDLDCALLRVHIPDREGGSVLPLGQSTPEQLGEFCLALGYPSRSESSRQLPRFCTATLGLVSSFDVSPMIHSGAYSRFEGPTGVLQTDAALNPGNSGGPLLDLQGRVIGVNASVVLGADNIGFAIPIDWIRQAILEALGAEAE